MTSQDRQEKAEAARLAHVSRLRMVRTLKDKGYNNAHIARQLGISENSVRLVLVGSMPEEER